MTILLFILILLALVVGHEFGHFVVAKISGMKVPEFGIGFPPKLWGKKIGNTEYTVNALPFGGFVKIVGEDITDETQNDPAAFTNRPLYAQAGTLLAGPGANLLIAFLLSSLAFMAGVPAGVDSGYDAAYIKNSHVVVVALVPGSPAEKAGLKEGDQVISISSGNGAHDIKKPEDISVFIQSAEGPVTLSLVRNNTPVALTLLPATGVVSSSPQSKAIGIATASVGTLALPFSQAIAAGFQETIRNIWSVLTGILSLIGHAFTFSVNLSNVAGPVGIANLVGDAAVFGLGSVLSFAALISINLGVINLFPFPALDGGRLALVFVEALSGRKVPARVANAINSIGFALLILLMVAITAHDLARLIA